MLAAHLYSYHKKWLLTSNLKGKACFSMNWCLLDGKNRRNIDKCEVALFECNIVGKIILDFPYILQQKLKKKTRMSRWRF